MKRNRGADEKSFRNFFGKSQKKPKRQIIASALGKIWRQPTLAESIKPLPSARLCLTAEFGMGSGRTTALWPPKIGGQEPWPGNHLNRGFVQIVKEREPITARSLKTAHRRYLGLILVRELNR